MEVLRTLLLLIYRLFLVVVLVSLFSFLLIDKPVLQTVYLALTEAQEAIGNTYAFLVNFFDHTDVLKATFKAYANSAILLFTAIFIGGSAGLLLGLISGLNPGSWLSGIISSISFVGVLIPSFLLALLVLVFFVRHLSPYLGFRLIVIGPEADVFEPRRLLAPVIVLSVRPMAYMAQVTIGALQEVIHRDYVRTAYAKGLYARLVLIRHVLPNIALPTLTGLNSIFFFSLSSLLVVEFLFIWRGVGWGLIDALDERDVLRVSYLLISIAVTFLLINTGIKLLIRRLDPRVAEQESVVS